MKPRRTLPVVVAAMIASIVAVPPAHAVELREVHGSLRTSNGVPFAGMSWMVKAVDGSWTDRGTISDDGSFTYWTPNGTEAQFWVGPGPELDDPRYGSIFCSPHDEYSGDGGTAILVPADQERLDIQTPPARISTVRVVDTDGQPVSNVRVLPDSWSTAAGEGFEWHGHNYRSCMNGAPSAPIAGYPGVSHVAAWLPGFMGGTTDHEGTAVIGTPGQLADGNVAVVKVKMRPGSGEQTMAVPTASLQGADPHRQSATLQLPQAPLLSIPPGDVPPGEANVQITAPTGEPIAGAQLALTPVSLQAMTLQTLSAAPVATATTDAHGVATFSGVARTGLYLATPTNVSARSVSLNVTGRPAAAAPAKAASVKVKPVSKKSKLRVDVNPNKGKGYWTFQVQKKRADGSWKPLKTYKTKGKKETRTINLKRGTYRVVVNPKYGYAGTTSAEVWLRK